MRKTVMNALRVDQWQQSLRRGFMETYSIDEASEQMLRELFAITDELKSALDDDDVKVFWIWAKRPTFKQYKAYYYDDEESANVTEEDKKEYYKRDFPNTRCWYKLQLAEPLLVFFHLRRRQRIEVLLAGTDDKKSPGDDVGDSAAIIFYGAVKFQPVELAFLVADNADILIQT